MKKLLYVGMLAIALSCLLASCSADTEELAEMPTNVKKKVTLTTSLDLASRANMVDENLELFYAVYDAGSGSIVEKNTAGLQTVTFNGNASVTLTLQLEESKTYDIAFWAQSKEQTYYDLPDLKAIKFRYEEPHSNDILRNTFYGSLFGLRVKDHTSATVALKSPFSTLEVLATIEDIKTVATIPDIEKQPLVFTAGRAWLNRNQNSTLANHYITRPIEFDVTVNDRLLADASINQ